MSNRPIFSCMFYTSRVPLLQLDCTLMKFRFEAPVDASDKVHAVKLEDDIIVVLETFLPDEWGNPKINSPG